MSREVQPQGRSVIGLRIMETGGVAAFIANDDPTTPGSPWTFASAGADAITTNTWHHLPCAGTAQVSLFVDGALRAATAYNPVPESGLSYFDGSALRLGAATSWGLGHPGDREFIV